LGYAQMQFHIQDSQHNFYDFLIIGKGEDMVTNNFVIPLSFLFYITVQDAQKIQNARIVSRDAGYILGHRRLITPKNKGLSPEMYGGKRLPPEAYHKYTFCCGGGNKPRDNVGVYGHDGPEHGEHFIGEFTPKDFGEIFVADHEAYLGRRKQLAEMANSDFVRLNPCLTKEEKRNAFLARAATIIPLTEYSGGYSKPIYLVGRMDAKRIELVGGPWPEFECVKRIFDRDCQARNLIRKAILSGSPRRQQDYGNKLLACFMNDFELLEAIVSIKSTQSVSDSIVVKRIITVSMEMHTLGLIRM
jgi:hypothetical protein